MFLFNKFVIIVVDVVFAIKVALHPRLNVFITGNVFIAMEMFLLAIHINIHGLNSTFIVMKMFVAVNIILLHGEVAVVHIMYVR